MSPFDADQRTFDRRFAAITAEFDTPAPRKVNLFVLILVADVIAFVLLAWAAVELIKGVTP